jgi:hypothetical protein
MLSDKKQADAYASVAQAHENFVNFLTGIGDIDLEDEELHAAATEIGRLLIQAKETLNGREEI